MASLLPSTSSSDPQSAIRVARQAPAFLKSNPARLPQFPFSLFTKAESLELWANYERLFVACLQAQDGRSALECLKRLRARFGPSNERIMALQGLYDEAQAKDDAGLETVLQGYEKVLMENPVNVVSTASLSGL
jgi:hypothetical protein